MTLSVVQYRTRRIDWVRALRRAPRYLIPHSSSTGHWATESSQVTERIREFENSWTYSLHDSIFAGLLYRCHPADNNLRVYIHCKVLSL